MRFRKGPILRKEGRAGAHVTIFARRQGPLDEARRIILTARRDEKQEVNAISLDLGDPNEVRQKEKIPYMADVVLWRFAVKMERSG